MVFRLLGRVRPAGVLAMSAVRRNSGEEAEPRTAPAVNAIPGLARRGLAYWLDCVFVFALVMAFQMVVWVPLRAGFGIDQAWFYSGVNTQMYTLLSISLPVWAYFVAFEASAWQATPGKRLCGIALESVDCRGGPTLPRALLRNLVKLLPWELAHIGNNLPTPLWYAETPQLRLALLLSLVLMVGYVAVILANPLRRAPHDFLAGTILKRMDRGGRPSVS